MTELEVNNFEKTQSQLEGLHKEISILSKKSPNDGINKFKLGFINQILENANELLTDIYVPLDGFTIFSVDELPTNSDATMILELYLNCFEKLRADNIVQKSGARWQWLINGEKSEIFTTPPRKMLLK